MEVETLLLRCVDGRQSTADSRHTSQRAIRSMEVTLIAVDRLEWIHGLAGRVWGTSNTMAVICSIFEQD